MSIRDKINQLQGKEEKSTLDEVIMKVCENYGWTVDEVLNMPYPRFIAILQVKELEAKRRKKDGSSKSGHRNKDNRG